MICSLCCLQVGKARHILCLGEKLMSSDRPDTVLIDPGIFSAGSECSSRSSLGSISLSSSFLSIASIPAGKPLRFTRDVDPVKVKETLLKKVNPSCSLIQPYMNVLNMHGLLRKLKSFVLDPYFQPGYELICRVTF